MAVTVDPEPEVVEVTDASEDENPKEEEDSSSYEEEELPVSEEDSVLEEDSESEVVYIDGLTSEVFG